MFPSRHQRSLQPQVSTRQLRFPMQCHLNPRLSAQRSNLLHLYRHFLCLQCHSQKPCQPLDNLILNLMVQNQKNLRQPRPCGRDGISFVFPNGKLLFRLMILSRPLKVVHQFSSLRQCGKVGINFGFPNPTSSLRQLPHHLQHLQSTSQNPSCLRRSRSHHHQAHMKCQQPPLQPVFPFQNIQWKHRVHQ